MSPAWMDDAECKGLDPNIFYPEEHERGASAKRVYSPCPVKAQCAEHAARHNEMGVWGGLSVKERRPLRRAIRRAA